MIDQPIVLVVDDEPQMVGVVSYALQVAGFEVLAAYNGRQALQYLGERAVDLIVLDIMMPGMDGWDLCRQIRSSTSIPIFWCRNAYKRGSGLALKACCTERITDSRS